jgi:glycosyltransferase involved in cell wall biosynthesis
LPTVSVIIPARDAEATLAETLDSIAAQTRKPDEIILVDDGSRDATAALAAAHPLRPFVLAAGGGGVASAINKGAKHAGGEWLAFLDSDDLWEQDWLESALAMARRTGVDAVIGDFESFLDPGVPAADAARLNYTKGRQPGYLSGALLMRRAAYRPMPEDLKNGHFVAFWDAFRHAGGTFALSGTLALRRRIRPGTLSSRGGDAKRAYDSDLLKVARAAIRRRRGEAV